MGQPLSMEISGFDALQKVVDKLAKDIQAKSKINAKAVLLVDRWIQQNFRKEGAEAGGWEPLAPSTQRSRFSRTGDTNPKTLQDKGWLRDKWKHYWDDNAAYIQSGVDYGGYHDSDDPRKSNLPQRMILPREKHIAETLMKLYDNWLGSLVK